MARSTDFRPSVATNVQTEDGTTVVDYGNALDVSTFSTTDAGTSGDSFTITNMNLSAGLEAGDSFTVVIDGETIVVEVTDIDETTGEITTNLPAAFETVFNAGVDVNVLDQTTAEFTGVVTHAEHASTVDVTNLSNDLNIITKVVTTTVTEYETEFPDGVGADPNTLYLLSEMAIS